MQDARYLIYILKLKFRQQGRFSDKIPVNIFAKLRVVELEGSIDIGTRCLDLIMKEDPAKMKREPIKLNSS